MDSKKKDLEIIYNLQWKNKPANGGDKANIIGMYDIPATTLNWEVFKSYLLKNSGTVGDDVKVSFITDSNREFPIESQTDFQIALYAFRRKARMGGVVNLKLDRISDNQPSHKNSRHSNDVETQFDNETPSLASTCCNADTPPDWFIAFMTQFKKSFTEEMTSTVSAIVSNIKPQTVSQPACYHSRKSKVESSKRIRKLHLPIVDSSHETKDIIKSLKLEGKLERKLEKLESKTKKIREKKLALFTKSSDSETGPSTSRSQSKPPCRREQGDELFQMDAAPTHTQDVIPHMLGGEIYLHQWEVINSGKSPWTNKTALMFTWGSKALKALDTVVSVPLLKPGEIGTISVRLQIPSQPGQYECYWHFHHNERRFGHWLGCQVIVDAFDLKGNKSVLETSFPTEFNLPSENVRPVRDDIYGNDVVTRYSNVWQGPAYAEACNNYTVKWQQNKDEKRRSVTSENLMPLEKHELEIFSDSDNQSIISLSDSNCSKGVQGDYIVVPIPDCFQVEKPAQAEVKSTENNDLTVDSTKDAVVEKKVKSGDGTPENFDDNNNSEETNQNASKESLYKTDEASSGSSRKSDIVMVTLPEDDHDTEEYALVIVDGQKVSIPKKIIKSEYLHTIEQSKKSSTQNSSRANSAASSIEMIKKEDLPTSEVPSAPEPTAEASEASTLIEQMGSSEVNNDLASHCSAAGSCFSNVNNAADKNARLFIFPEDCPGFEVLYPNLDSLLSDPEFPSGLIPETKNEDQIFPNFPCQPPTESMEEPATLTDPNYPVLNLSTHDRNPFIPTTTTTTDHVPNYQQTPPRLRSAPPQPTVTQSSVPETPPHVTSQQIPAEEAPRDVPTGVRMPATNAAIHILPEPLVHGAVNVASTAFHTARSVINRILPQEQYGRWINGHWVSSNPTTIREANLQALAEMGFWNRDMNATLLARYNDDLSRVVAELVQ
ncbi:hypothetical protein JTB14_010723 [Gonioctena quinquepunctata]|nr:hypothetical protein JTB14_010723 [Gonioctena quinquepunctata]